MVAACGGSDQVVRQIEVIKEVPVEKIVVKEVINEVTKVVTKEVVVQPTPGPKRTLVFAGLDWTSAQVQNGVA